MPTDLCPWLGTDEDRDIRYFEPSEAHVCYAQRPEADIDPEHQAGFCLTAEHRTCPFYRQVPVARPPVAILPKDPEDEMGPLPRRFPVVRVLLVLVAIVLAGALIYAYGSALLMPLPTTTPSSTPAPGITPSPTATSSPTSTPTLALAQASPSPAFEFVDPTATPTPYPGGAIYSLSPGAGAAGWVASDEARGNHLGDSYLYTGVFDGVSYHGVFQFDLSAVPRGATIHAATLEIAGLDARRLGSSGVWELRVLTRDADQEWNRKTYQDVHNAQVQWTLSPALGVGDLVVGETDHFELSRDQTRDLEERLLEEHYTVSFRLDGPLAGENSVFAWDTGYGPASQGRRPRLLLNVGAPPLTPIPSGSPPPTSSPTPSVTPTPTDTPEWVVVTSTPTPGNAVTAAAVAVQETVRATTTGTATATAEFMATATPRYIVVTNTPTPANRATAVYMRSLATANVILTGTPTPTPHHLVTATYTPRPTRTPVLVWLDKITGTPTSTATPRPTAMPPIPSVLRGKIAFLSDRGGWEEPGVYLLDPASGRVALLTSRWPYEVALAQDRISPDGKYLASVKDGERGTQIYVTQLSSGISWAITFAKDLSYEPAWSPRGDLIAYVSQEMGPQGGSDDIFGVNPQGAEKRRLTFNTWEWDKHPSFSPDGTQIVYWSNQTTGLKQLWIMSADGSNRRILLHSPFNDWDPVWIK
jgi:hypothetical protein